MNYIEFKDKNISIVDIMVLTARLGYNGVYFNNIKFKNKIRQMLITKSDKSN